MGLLGLRVLGTTDQIAELLEKHKPDEVVIAIPSAPGELRASVVAACRERQIPVRTLPTVFELLRGGVQLTRQLREVQVEDVLGRDPVVMELDRVGAYLRGPGRSWSPGPAARSAPSSRARSRGSARGS